MRRVSEKSRTVEISFSQTGMANFISITPGKVKNKIHGKKSGELYTG
jgi:hypothetical protein